MLVFHHQFHVHVVVTATAFHGAFNQVLSLFLRSDERIVLSPFSQADVPALIAELLHHEAVHRPVSRLLTPEVGGDPQHDLFSGLGCDDRLLFTRHFERIVFVGDHFNHTPHGGRAGREHAYDDQPREQKSSYGSTDVHGCSLAYLSLLSPAIEVAYLCPYASVGAALAGVLSARYCRIACVSSAVMFALTRMCMTMVAVCRGEYWRTAPWQRMQLFL